MDGFLVGRSHARPSSRFASGVGRLGRRACREGFQNSDSRLECLVFEANRSFETPHGQKFVQKLGSAVSSPHLPAGEGVIYHLERGATGRRERARSRGGSAW